MGCTKIPQEPLLILTCEHASNNIPNTFKGIVPEEILKTHRGYDIGAEAVYDTLVKRLRPKFHCKGKFSRLYSDLNRNAGNKGYSEIFQKNGEEYWNNYFKKINDFILKNTDNINNFPKIIHLGIHTFTPILEGKVRKADVGILFDPDRLYERRLAKILKNEILQFDPNLKVRFNYPYLGTSEGLTTFLRQKYGPQYLGLEIEINQKFF